MNDVVILAKPTIQNKEDVQENIVRFEDVKDQSTKDYFNGNQFSIDAFNKKYICKEGETYVQALKRVCDFIASVEKTEKERIYWSERWFDEIYNDWWHPAGSIMQGANSGKKISLCNCCTISLGTNKEDEEWDSLEAIFKNTSYTVAKSAAYRQGLGVDFSRLRPRGTNVLNSANESTGSIHWMSFIDQIGYYVGQKGRIPAFLFSLSCSHPDIEEFITVKSDYTRIQNANISVQCTDDFYKAVENNDKWELHFEIPEVKKGEKIYVDVHSITMECKQDENGWYYISKHDRKSERMSKMVKARKLMELIAKNMYANAEPGIQNIDIARKYSNSDYVYDPKANYDSRVISTNACSEQYLSRDSLCVLSSANMARFSSRPDEYELELEIIGESINRFLDNVNECEIQYNLYATPHQKLAIEGLRRTGAGFTNAAGWLFKKNLGYGSKEGNDAIEHFTKCYNYYLYRSSINIGKEKGSFKLFNREKLEKSPFIKRMMKEGLVFEALRNVTVSSIAPCGTLSLMFRDSVMSYGIEPAIGIYYWKRTRISGKYHYYFCVPNVVRKVFAEHGHEIPMKSDTIRDTWNGKHGKPIVEFINSHIQSMNLNFCNAIDISPMDKLNLMGQVMKWIDSSISVTYMLPESSTWQDVFNFIIEAHKQGVKSIAAFPDKKMYGIISYMPFKELALKLKSEGLEMHPQNFDDDELKELNLSKEQIKLHTESVPERLEVLEAEIYSITAQGEKFLIVIGLQNGVPYEIFGGSMNGLNFKGKRGQGTITRISRGKYSLEFNDIVIDDFSQQFTPIEVLLFRSASLMLRSGIPIEFMVDQFQKSTDSMVSLTSAICRVLKQYIKDGQLVIGRLCPACHKSNTLIYHEGCVECSACGHKSCE